MAAKMFVLKVPDDLRADEFHYEEDEDGVIIFRERDEAFQHMSDNGFSQELIEGCEIIGSIGACFRCGSPLFPSDIPGYESQCFTCDEDFYSIEQECEKQ